MRALLNLFSSKLRRCLKSISNIGILMLLGACASQSTLESERAQSALVGMPKSQLMRCAGVPERVGTDDRGREYLSYSSEKTVDVPTSYPAPGFYPGFSYYGHRPRYFGSFHYYTGPTWRQETRKCTAIFAMENNRVAALTYSLNDSDSFGMGQCYQIVRNCLPPKPGE